MWSLWPALPQHSLLKSSLLCSKTLLFLARYLQKINSKSPGVSTLTQLSLSDRALVCLVGQLGPGSELGEAPFQAKPLQCSMAQQGAAGLMRTQLTSLHFKTVGHVHFWHIPSPSPRIQLFYPSSSPVTWSKHYEAFALAFFFFLKKVLMNVTAFKTF